MLTNIEISQIQSQILHWFAKNGRYFPWRRTKNPYNILIAEKLLQQTIARNHVVKAYETIISRFPNVNELANANRKQLEEIIESLGLTYRAKELIILSNQIVKKHNSKVPDNVADLLSLHGIGDYSARAILSFAYNEDVPIVDTNVARFIQRFFGLDDPISKNPARSTKLRELAESLLPQGKSKEFNLGILDLCALICKARSPECFECPLQKNCDYGKSTL